ncbi:MAG: hypothetical protein DWH79_09700 [Planctomycetota bacterium]|nr:MAG: hypothetical protein DWH79_09700 [Planctomycetota bacterium]
MAADDPFRRSVPAAPVSRYAAWAGSVRELCSVVDLLKPLAAELGAPDPAESEWFGQLFGKLRPQVTREPILVVAVCGGTNTGKSLVANVLVGGEISRSVPEAARTRCPVASLPVGLAARIDLEELFPGFTPRPWSSGVDALGGGSDGDDLLIWREDPSGRQSQRLILIDTPDVDGTLRENWHRAEAVRNACDVIVAVLTQQKYNDAAVRDFFAAAAAARKSLIVVFNMVNWPAQRERIAGWLATFTAETGAAPLAVYAVPHDFSRAEAGTIEFFPLPELTGNRAAGGPIPPPSEPPADLATVLSAVDFDRIKLRAMEGAFRVVLDPRAGMGAWLDAFESSSRGWQEARTVLAEEAQVRVELPSAPRELVWHEIWEWLEPRRSRIDINLSRVYRVAGSGVAWMGRRIGVVRSAQEKQEDFATVELSALTQALTAFIDRLDAARRRNPRLEKLLGDALVYGDRASWYADLERRHTALPMVSEDYRSFVRGELDRFSRENPRFLQMLLTGLSLGSVARPCITVGLMVAGAAAVPAVAAASHGLTTLVHTAGDYVVWAVAPLAGEGVLGLTMAGLKPLLERLFAGWSAERSRVLTETLHDVVLGDRLEEIERLAGAAARPEVARARRLLHECGREVS